MLLSDSDTSDDDDQPVTEARFKHILQEHMMLKRMKDQFQLTLPIHVSGSFSIVVVGD